MARVVIAPEAREMIGHDFGHALPTCRDDIEPHQHRPKPVLFADVIGAGAEAFLATEAHPARIHQVAEELPAGGRLVAVETHRRRDPIHGGRGRHRTRDPLQPVLVARHQMCIGRKHGEAIRGRYIDLSPEDHVAVAIPVRGRAEIGAILGHHLGHQLMRPGGVRIGMHPAEIGQGLFMGDCAFGRAQPVFEYLDRIGAGDRAHAVHAHRESFVKKATQRFEIEQGFHQVGIGHDRIDDFDDHRAEVAFANGGQVHVGGL